MTKIVKIDGMSCEHCKAHVLSALNGISGLQAIVDLDAGTATVASNGVIDDAAVKAAVEEAGYNVVSIADA